MAGKTREQAEAARVRRRWLTLGEVLAIAAVAISALTLWNSYSERRSSEAEHREDRAKTSRVAATLFLQAEPKRDGRVLLLAPRTSGQSIDSQTIRFPSALGLSPVETTSNPRLDRDWFAAALVKARRAAGMKEGVGDARLPVLIETRYVAEGESLVARDLYAIGYTVESGLLSGTHIKLHGLSRTGRAHDMARGQAAIDAAWKAQGGGAD